MKKPFIIGLIAVLAAGAGGFLGGIKYQKTKSSRGGLAQAGQQYFNGNRGPGRSGGRGGPGFVGGSIIAKDQNSITVKNQDGGSKIILISAKTNVGKTTAGTADDLSVGENVIVNGSVNSDGSITANNIQIRPQMPSITGQDTTNAAGK